MKLTSLILLTFTLPVLAQDIDQEAVILQDELQYLRSEAQNLAKTVTPKEPLESSPAPAQASRIKDMEDLYFEDAVSTDAAAPKRKRQLSPKP